MTRGESYPMPVYLQAIPKILDFGRFLGQQIRLGVIKKENSC